jgi:hypothetical protein
VTGNQIRDLRCSNISTWDLISIQRGRKHAVASVLFCVSGELEALQRHPNDIELLLVVRGNICAIMGGNARAYNEGATLVLVKTNLVHEELEALEVQRINGCEVGRMDNYRWRCKTLQGKCNVGISINKKKISREMY